MDDLRSRRPRADERTFVPGEQPPFGAPPFGSSSYGAPPSGASAFASPSMPAPAVPLPYVPPQRAAPHGGPYPVTAPYGGPYVDPYSAPPVGPARWGRGPLVALIAAVTAVVFVGVVTLVVLLRAAPPGSGAAPPPPTPTPALASDVTGVFPDITTRGPACSIYTPREGEFVTTSGQHASVVQQCRYDDLAPGAAVFYIQWPSSAAAREWYDDTVHQSGPALDQRDQWTVDGVAQGPLHTWQGERQVITTGVYDDRAYTFDVYADTQAQGDAVFAAIPLRPGTQIAP